MVPVKLIIFYCDHRTPDLGYDFAKNEGRPFNYFTFGAAVSEVEIDCLTGDHTVLRTDIVMDVGDSINPAIDIGQVGGKSLYFVGRVQHWLQGLLLHTKSPNSAIARTP